MDEKVVAIVQIILDRQPAGIGATGAVVATRMGGETRIVAPARSGVPPPFQRDSRFLLYSFTKTLVAAALLRLVAEGHLSLQDTLERWWPEVPPAKRLTLRNVMLHASGLPNYGDIADYHAAVRAASPPWSESEFLRRTNAGELLFEPGTAWAYSNIGYMLLRRVLAAVGNGDMETVLRRLIFDPLEITSASVPVAKPDLASFTFGLSRYLGGDGPPVAVREHYDPGWIATGVVGASAADAARLLSGILQTLLPLPLRDEMMRQAARFRGPFPGRPWRLPAYGLGLMIDLDEERGPIYGHTGSGPGCSPAVYHFPTRSPPLTIAVATDGEDQSLAEDIVLAVAACMP
ncbi:MAG TPA: serine hydrolase domain-containing protein [Acetobacteraceae bacterium]|jgi:CubicO group peptidase (beta-lactamase class C family)